MTPALDAVRLTQDLIRVDTTPTGDIGPAFDLVADILDVAGLAVSVHRESRTRVNLVATGGRADVPGPCLTGHLDTVPVVAADWTADPWAGELRDGLLHGRGATDMKGGVAAAVVAAVQVSREHPELPLRLVLTSEEEIGALGAAALADEGLLPPVSDLVVAEPTDLLPRNGHRGALWLDLTAHGTAAHGSTPHLGRSAYDLVAEDLAWMRALIDSGAPDPELGPDTINVGLVRAGTQRNVVPAHASAQVDIRLGPATYDAVRAAVRGGRLPGGSELDVVCDMRPVVTSRDEPVVAVAEELTATRAEPALYFTDASVLTPALGQVPTLILGPGSPSQAHVADEYCPADQITQAARWYADLLLRLAPSGR